MNNLPTCCVVGLGYVGQPLVIELCKAGYKVFGIDSSSKIVEGLSEGITQVEGIKRDLLESFIRNGTFIPSVSFENVANSSAIFICVPTPLDKSRNPDLKYLISATESVAKHLKEESLVVIESTIAPGTTREILLPLIQSISGLSFDQINLAFSPERIDPLNSIWRLDNTPKLLAGVTKEAESSAHVIYSKFVQDIYVCESLEVAEAAKLLENTFRLVNISFINEFSVFCQKMGINVVDVINAASTKPYGFMAFYPGIGVGGHCIPVDPLYLSNKARDIGAPTKFIDLADQINQDISSYHIARAEEKIRELNGKKILIVGVSYKPNVSDTRETPVESLVADLRKRGAIVSWHDDLVKEWEGEISSQLTGDYDLAIIATKHDYVDLKKLGTVPILDTRNSLM